MQHKPMKNPIKLFMSPAATLTLLVLALIATPLVSALLPYKSHPTSNNICMGVCVVATYLLPVVIIASPLFAYDMRRKLICALAACASVFCSSEVLRLTVEWRHEGEKIAGLVVASVVSLAMVYALTWLLMRIKGEEFSSLSRRGKAIHIVLTVFATAVGAFLLWQSMRFRLYTDHSEDATVGPIVHWGFPLPVRCTAPGYSIATSASLFKFSCLAFNFYFWVFGVYACCRLVAATARRLIGRRSSGKPEAPPTR